ncbi:MAG: hypothetical protein AAF602_32725 [Myxococcota bacterium]
MSRTFAIEPVGIHWLEPASPLEICAHGGIRIVADGEVWLDDAEESWSLNVVCLNLTRAPGVVRFPHCGHAVVTGDDGQPVNLGCLHNRDLTVTGLADRRVRVATADRHVEVAEPDWFGAVVDFIGHVKRFYAASPARKPIDDDRAGHEALWREVDGWLAAEARGRQME